MIVINKPSGLVSEETRNNKYPDSFLYGDGILP